MLSKGKKPSVAGHIRGLIPHLIEGVITHLQYADDTIIIIQLRDLEIGNLKFLLVCFESMSGLRTNFHTSEVMALGFSDLEQKWFANMLNCKQGSFPFTYLDFLVGDQALTTLDWGVVTCKVSKREDL
jgi:hypothetical protein